MVLDNVARIEAPAPEDFFHEYVRTGTPVIITNLFDPAPIGGIRTVDQALRELRQLRLEIQPNYITFLETGCRGSRRSMTLADYVAHVREEPETVDLCVELSTPVSLRNLMPPPDYCRLNDPSDVVSATFVANAGNYNHLHFDDDLRDVLLYQVFGKKRFAIVHPREGRKLDAFLTLSAAKAAALASLPSRDANGRVFLEDLAETDKAGLLKYLNAADTLLYPGETLFIPMLSWHYVEYEETAMSVTYRLGRTRLTRLIADAIPRPTIFLQEVLAALQGDRDARRYPDVPGALELACLRNYETAQQRSEAVHAEITKIYDRLFGGSAESVAVARALHRRSLAAATGALRGAESVARQFR